MQFVFRHHARRVRDQEDEQVERFAGQVQGPAVAGEDPLPFVENESVKPQHTGLGHDDDYIGDICGPLPSSKIPQSSQD